MKYNIYQITEKQVYTKDRISACSFFDEPFNGCIGDVADREKELERFGRWLSVQKLGALSGETFTLTANVRQERFSSRYRAFLKAAAAVCSVTDEQFQSDTGVDSLLFSLCQLFTDKFDDYVFYDDELIPMDKFLRIAKPEVAYHIGGICEYQ